jgi:hypothetical protein
MIIMLKRHHDSILIKWGKISLNGMWPAAMWCTNQYNAIDNNLSKRQGEIKRFEALSPRQLFILANLTINKWQIQATRALATVSR